MGDRYLAELPGHEFFNAALGMAVDDGCQGFVDIGDGVNVVELAGLCRPANYAD